MNAEPPQPGALLGDRWSVDPRDIGYAIAFDNHKIAFAVKHISFGARYPKDRWLPLPRQWKCTTFHAVATL